MRYAGVDADDDRGWFRVGTVDITSTFLVLLIWTVTLVVWTVEGPGLPVQQWLFLEPSQVLRGELWRVATWPFGHFAFDLVDVLSAAMVGMFGTHLERDSGRKPFGALLVAIVLLLSIGATILSLVIDGGGGFDLGMLALILLLLFCAEHPRAPFFFGIPAWVIGSVFAAIAILNDIHDRQWLALATLLLCAWFIGLAAYQIGLLRAYPRLFRDLAFVERFEARQRDRSRPSDRPTKKPKAKRSRGGLASKLGRQPEAEIVEMPTAPRRSVPPVVVPDTVNADDLALDALLDKISAGGMDALTDDERRQLDEIRARRSSTD